LSLILPGDLAEANKRDDALAAKLEQSEKARKKAEADAAAVEDLRKRLHDAETSLSENIAQQSARETEILTRLESQSRRFVSKCSDPCCFTCVIFVPFFV
jgi:septal ring factor EnvC (AmiA/AmiB activator)